jgi:arylsulfatase A-like enzyme
VKDERTKLGATRRGINPGHCRIEGRDSSGFHRYLVSNADWNLNKGENGVTGSAKNIIWIFGDQHRAQALGCNGDPNANTPNIDRLSAEGLNFERALSGFPLCCPARGSLLTSKYPHACVPGHQHQMPPESKTIAHAFKDNGYHTAYFGKWHLDGFQEGKGKRAAMHIVPPERRGGFDEWVGFENNNSQFDCWVHGGEGESAFHERLPGYETDCLTDMLLDYIKGRGHQAEKEDGGPFFAALSVQPPHDPYVAPAEFMARHNPAEVKLRDNVPAIPSVEAVARRDLAGYYAMIENLDWNVGRIRAALTQTGLDHDTHILFFSDHGDMHGSHGQFRKTSPWEESIRVPFIVGGISPRYVGLSGRSSSLMNHVDVAPTTLGLCGIETPEWMDGFDYSKERLGGRPESAAPDSAFLQAVIPTGHGGSIDRPWRGVVSNEGWKYVVLEGQPWMLFNLNEDPYEFANHAHDSKYGAERKKLQERLGQWISETGDSFDLPML